MVENARHELHAKVRRCVIVDRHSQREAARHFGISGEMAAKMVVNAQASAWGDP